MSERLRESLSALMDDAADDLELARVLRAMDEDEEVSETWSRYHLVSAVLRGGDAGAADVPRPVEIDVGDEAFDAEPGGLAAAEPVGEEQEAPAAAARGLPSWASFAAAASVTLAVVVALQWPGAGPEAPVIAAAPVTDTGPVLTDTRSVLPATSGAERAQSLPDTLLIPSRLALRPAPTDAERQVDAYMLYHAEYSAANSGSGMVPLARFASFEGGRRAP